MKKDPGRYGVSFGDDERTPELLCDRFTAREPLAWTLPQLHVELFKSQHRSYKSDLLSFIWNLSRLIFLDLARQTITMLLRLILKSWAQVTPLSQPPK